MLVLVLVLGAAVLQSSGDVSSHDPRSSGRQLLQLRTATRHRAVLSCCPAEPTYTRYSCR